MKELEEVRPATVAKSAGAVRFRELDGLRGIAAFAVILSHYTYLFDVIFPGHSPFPVAIPLGGLGVSLFFMISGFISYPLYLLHQNIGYVVILHTVDAVGVWVSRVLALSASLFLAWLVHEMVEVRLSRTINRWLRARRPAAEERP